MHESFYDQIFKTHPKNFAKTSLILTKKPQNFQKSQKIRLKNHEMHENERFRHVPSEEELD